MATTILTGTKISGSLGSTSSLARTEIYNDLTGTTAKFDQFGLTIDSDQGWYPLTVTSPYETAARFLSEDGTANIEIGDNSSTSNYNRIQVVGNDRMEFYVNNVEMMELQAGEITINQGGANINTRIEGDHQENLVFIDAGQDAVGIGKAMNNGDEKLYVGGDVGITGSLHVSGNITTSGSIIAKEFRTEFVNQIIATSSGSTTFGDTPADDTHRFTGSLQVSGAFPNLSFPAVHSADKIRLYSGGNEKIGTAAHTMILTATSHSFKDTDGHENFKIGPTGDAELLATGRLFFDGGGHTYIAEVSDDLLEIWVGATRMLKFQEGSDDFVYTPNNVYLAVGDSQDLTLNHNGSNSIIQNATGGMFFRQRSAGTMVFDDNNGVEHFNIDMNTAVIVNEGGANNIDFRVESNNHANMLFVDAGNDNIAIGNTTADATLHIGDSATGIFTLGTASGSTIDLLKLEADLTNAGQLLYRFEREATGSDWTTAGLKILARTDVTEQAWIKFNGAGNTYGLAFGAGTGGNNLAMRIDQNKDVTIQAGGLSIPATEKLIFDSGSGHTYIHESAGDVLDFFVGGQQMLRLYEGGTDYVHVQDNTRLGVGNDPDLIIYHDGSNSSIENLTGNLYIDEHTNDGEMIFRCDDGSGGVTPYITLVGSSTKVQIDKPTFISSSIQLDSANQRLLLTDNIQLKLGTGGDLFAYHDGSNTLFRNNTGHLYIDQLADDSDIILRSDDGSGGVASYITLDGGLGYTTVHKHMRFDDAAQLYIGTGADLQIYHDGTNSVINNLTGDLQIYQNLDDKDIILLSDDGSGGTTAYLTLDGSSATTIHQRPAFFGTSFTSATTTLHVSSSGVHGILIDEDGANNDISSRLLFREQNSTIALYNTGDTFSFRTGATVNSTSGTQRFYVNTSGANVSGDLSVSGNSVLQYGLVVNEGSHDADFRVEGNGDAHLLRTDAANDKVGIGTGSPGEKLEVIGNISASINSTGSFNSVAIPDGGKVIFGASEDIQIYHNGGGNSNFENHSGDLYFTQYTNDGDIIFRTDDGSGGVANYIQIDGGSEYVYFHKDIALKATEKLYLDGGGNTYIYEDAADRVRFFVGGAEFLRFTETTTNEISLYENVVLPATKKLFLDGGSNTYIHEQSADDLEIVVGGDVLAKFEGDTIVLGGGYAVSSSLAFFGQPESPKHMAYGEHTVASEGWHRLARCGTVADGASNGTRASAKFTVYDTDSSRHSAVTFYVSGHFGQNFNIRVINSSDYGGTHGVIEQIRIVHGSTYEGFGVDVYVKNNGDSAVRYVMEENYQDNGWTPENFAAVAADPPTNMAATAISCSYASSNVVDGFAHGNGTANGAVRWYRTENGVNFQSGSGGYAELKTNSRYRVVTDAGYAEIGPQNASFNHIMTDRPKNYFNKQVIVDEGIVASYDEDLQLQRANSTDDRITIEASAHRFTVDATDRAVLTSAGLALDQNIRVGNGSEGTPSISFGNDTDSGIYRRAANQVGIVCAGEDQVYVSDGTISIEQPVKFQFANDQRIYDNGSGGLRVGAASHELELYCGGSDPMKFITGGISGNERLRLETAGDLHCDGDVIAASTTISDKRLKDNIITIDNGLSLINQIRGVKFDWNKGSRKGQKDIGLIAQEVEKVLPELVREKKMALIDDKEYLTVDYDKMVAVLVEAVKEQQVQIEELKEDIKELKK